MSFYNRRNAAVGYLTLKAMQRAIAKKRRKRRSGMKVAAYVGLGLVSAGILAAALAIVLKRRHGDAEDAGLRERLRDRRRVRHRAGASPGHVSEPQVGDDASLIRPALAGLVRTSRASRSRRCSASSASSGSSSSRRTKGRTGPFPEAQEAIARAALELNRYPDGGAWRLRNALAERHGVRFEQVTVCAGADAVVGYVCQATLDPGDEVVTGWPSFPSYVLDPLKLGATPVRVPLRDDRIDLDALLAAITPRTKLVFVAAPNNPTGHDERPGRARRVLRARPAARPHRPRPGLLRVHRRFRVSGRSRGVPPGGSSGPRPADLLQDLRSRRAARRLRDRPRGGRHGDREGAPRVRRDLGRPGGGAGEPRRRDGARSAPCRTGTR